MPSRQYHYIRPHSSSKHHPGGTREYVLVQVEATTSSNRDPRPHTRHPSQRSYMYPSNAELRARHGDYTRRDRPNDSAPPPAPSPPPVAREHRRGSDASFASARPTPSRGPARSAPSEYGHPPSTPYQSRSGYESITFMRQARPGPPPDYGVYRPSPSYSAYSAYSAYRPRTTYGAGPLYGRYDPRPPYDRYSPRGGTSPRSGYPSQMPAGSGRRSTEDYYGRGRSGGPAYSPDRESPREPSPRRPGSPERPVLAEIIEPTTPPPGTAQNVGSTSPVEEVLGGDIWYGPGEENYGRSHPHHHRRQRHADYGYEERERRRRYGF